MISDWLKSPPAETKVEAFGLSLWSQQKTNPKSEMTQYVYHADVDDKAKQGTANLAPLPATSWQYKVKEER